MTQKNMFSPNPDEVATTSEQRPLEVVIDGESASVPAAESATFPSGGRSMVVKNLAKGGEVKKGESNVARRCDPGNILSVHLAAPLMLTRCAV